MEAKGIVWYLRGLWEHASWADGVLLHALESAPDTATEPWREFWHVIGTAEVWLARLEGREPRSAVWPRLTRAEVSSLMASVDSAYQAYLAELSEADAEKEIEYTNSAGDTFRTPIGEVLLHVALHGQYHRGKVNLLLREAGLEPAPVDFVAFVRGSPAAVTPRHDATHPPVE